MHKRHSLLDTIIDLVTFISYLTKHLHSNSFAIEQEKLQHVRMRLDNQIHQEKLRLIKLHLLQEKIKRQNPNDWFAKVKLPNVDDWKE